MARIRQRLAHVTGTPTLTCVGGEDAVLIFPIYFFNVELFCIFSQPLTFTMLARIARQSRSVVRSLSSSTGSYNTILTETRGSVAVITLNRPKALNALCDELIAELNTAASQLDKDPNVKAIVITGSDRAFAAGADIKEMADRDYMEAYQTNMFEVWGNLAKVQTPTIAAVRGFALGGGCELAMTCDIMIAGACTPLCGVLKWLQSFCDAALTNFVACGFMPLSR